MSTNFVLLLYERQTMSSWDHIITTKKVARKSPGVNKGEFYTTGSAGIEVTEVVNTDEFDEPNARISINDMYFDANDAREAAEFFTKLASALESME